MKRAAALAFVALWLASRRPPPHIVAADEHDDDLPGLEVVARKVELERQIRLSTYDALGVKAGVIATATVALTALTAGGWRPLVVPGLVSAAFALVLALVVVWPRELDQFKARQIRSAYLTRPPQVALREILDTEIFAVEKIVGFNRKLARATMASLGFLALSAILLISAVIVSDSIKESSVPEKPSEQPTSPPQPDTGDTPSSIAFPPAPPLLPNLDIVEPERRSLDPPHATFVETRER